MDSEFDFQTILVPERRYDFVSNPSKTYLGVTKYFTKVLRVVARTPANV